MGLWIAENEGAKFWLGVLTELQQRDVEDILIACVDGLKGFPDAINTFTQILMSNSVSWKDYKAVTADLKSIYQLATEEEALLELDRFNDTWGEQYLQISKSWHNHWLNLNTFF
ncbi:hypothetical protein GCM10009347_14270 [Shewanella algicola]|nr:hypothetical protein GCM10009347_14270 [Shewanella algicola]